jgi:hypothetical protein
MRWSLVQRLFLAAILFLAALQFVACERNVKPLGIDPNVDRPQSEGRDKLRDDLGTLTALPASEPNRKISMLYRGMFYPNELGLFVTTVSTVDSVKLPPRLELHRWQDGSLRRLDTVSLPVQSFRKRDVNNDKIDDLVCNTLDTVGRPGLTILRTDAATGRMRYMFRIDTIRPVFYKLADSTLGLLQYDSLVDWSVGSFVVPKRLYRISQDVYMRKAFDSTWLRVIRYMRDSVYQSFQAERERVRTVTGQVGIEQAEKYLRALGALVMLNPSWVSARSFLANERTFMAGHMTESTIAFIDRMLGLPRVSPFVEVAHTPEEEEYVILLSEFDEAFRSGDQSRAAIILPRLGRVLRDQATIERVSEIATLPGNALVLVEATTDFWELIASRYPNAAIAYRRWGILERRLGREDTAQVLLRRSLMLDSTSREAQEIRQSLPY